MKKVKVRLRRYGAGFKMDYIGPIINWWSMKVDWRGRKDEDKYSQSQNEK